MNGRYGTPLSRREAFPRSRFRLGYPTFRSVTASLPHALGRHISGVYCSSQNLGIPVKSVVVGALLIAIAMCSGCAVPTTTVLPSAVSGAPVVLDRSARERDSYWVARYEDVVQAALRAGETLALELKTDDIQDDRARLLFSDEHKAEMAFYIERRTSSVTLLRYIGGSGELSSFADLFVQQLVEELRNADAFLVDWKSSLQD